MMRGRKLTERAFLFKSLATAGNLACVGFVSSMDAAVLIQGLLCRERIITDLAGERFVYNMLSKSINQGSC